MAACSLGSRVPHACWSPAGISPLFCLACMDLTGPQHTCCCAMRMTPSKQRHAPLPETQRIPHMASQPHAASTVPTPARWYLQLLLQLQETKSMLLAFPRSSCKQHNHQLLCQQWHSNTPCNPRLLRPPSQRAQSAADRHWASLQRCTADAGSDLLALLADVRLVAVNLLLLGLVDLRTPTAAGTHTVDEPHRQQLC